MSSLKAYFCTLNLFRPRDGVEDEYEKRINVIASRIYLLLIFVIVLIIIFDLSLIPFKEIVAIKNPSRVQFESLSNQNCPCSSISLSYGGFISLQPLFHPVCSSNFVSNQWITLLYSVGNDSTLFRTADLRASGFVQFEILASFCRMSQANINQSLSIFESTSLISPQVLSESVLKTQVESAVNQMQKTAPNTFYTQIQLINSITMNNKLIIGLKTRFSLQYIDGASPTLVRLDNTHFDDNGNLCDCVQPFPCPGPSEIYPEVNITTIGYDSSPALMNIPGLRIDCLPVNGNLQLSLECFFNQSCVNAIISYLDTTENFMM
jgi:hypothetical protein